MIDQIDIFLRILSSRKHIGPLYCSVFRWCPSSNSLPQDLHKKLGTNRSSRGDREAAGGMPPQRSTQSILIRWTGHPTPARWSSSAPRAPCPQTVGHPDDVGEGDPLPGVPCPGGPHGEGTVGGTPLGWLPPRSSFRGGRSTLDTSPKVIARCCVVFVDEGQSLGRCEFPPLNPRTGIAYPGPVFCVLGVESSRVFFQGLKRDLSSPSVCWPVKRQPIRKCFLC